MFKHATVSIILLGFLLTALAQSGDNPAREGFNSVASDARAIEIADQVMTALGGHRNWEQTRHITWNFFGRRTLTWDRWTADYRLQADTLLVLMNLKSSVGRAWINGEEVNDPGKRQAFLKRASSIWINDSYWLIMPYKLKDSGVTLKHLGEGRSESGESCDILQLTFEKVGDTPQNKYHVYVSKASRLVVEWAYFSNAADGSPRIRNPWTNWKKYGNIMLSGDRGDGRQLQNIAVFEHLPPDFYTLSEPLDVMQYQAD